MPFFVWLIANNALYDWWLQDFVGHAIVISGVKAHFPFIKRVLHLISSLFPNNIWVIFPLVNIAVFFTTLQKIIRSDYCNTRTFILFLITLVSLFSWLQYFPIHWAGHSHWAAAPMFGVVTFVIIVFYRIYSNYYKTSKTVAISIMLPFILLVVLVGKQISENILMGAERISKFKYDLNVPVALAGMKVESAIQKDALESLDYEITRFYNTHHDRSLISLADENILVLTFRDDNKIVGPFRIPPSGFLAKYYNYNKKFNNYISSEKPLIFSDKDESINGYKEIFRIKYTPNFVGAETGTWLLYAPN